MFQYNCRPHRGINRISPYFYIHNQKPRVGISSLPMSRDLIDSIRTETELWSALGIPDDNTCDTLGITKFNNTQAPSKGPNDDGSGAMDDSNVLVANSAEDNNKIAAIIIKQMKARLRVL